MRKRISARKTLFFGCGVALVWCLIFLTHAPRAYGQSEALTSPLQSPLPPDPATPFPDSAVTTADAQPQPDQPVSPLATPDGSASAARANAVNSSLQPTASLTVTVPNAVGVDGPDGAPIEPEIPVTDTTEFTNTAEFTDALPVTETVPVTPELNTDAPDTSITNAPPQTNPPAVASPTVPTATPTLAPTPTSALIAPVSVANAPLASVLRVETMILVLLCLIGLSVNFLGMGALIVALLYMRTHIQSTYETWPQDAAHPVYRMPRRVQSQRGRV